MKFLEKDLETIIWENYEGCYARGLSIREIGAMYGESRHRQVSLGPYGIADLVNVSYHPSQNRLHVQVIECKKDDVNLATYGQAKRYLTAVKQVLNNTYGIEHENTYITEEVVLIGRRFDNREDFPFVYNADDNCTAFTYEYGLEGLQFNHVPKTWNRSLKHSEGATATFLNAFAAELKARSDADIKVNEQRCFNLISHGDSNSTLLVTSEGVIVNLARLDRFEEDGY